MYIEKIFNKKIITLIVIINILLNITNNKINGNEIKEIHYVKIGPDKLIIKLTEKYITKIINNPNNLSPILNSEMTKMMASFISRIINNYIYYDQFTNKCISYDLNPNMTDCKLKLYNINTLYVKIYNSIEIYNEFGTIQARNENCNNFLILFTYRNILKKLSLEEMRIIKTQNRKQNLYVERTSRDPRKTHEIRNNIVQKVQPCKIILNLDEKCYNNRDMETFVAILFHYMNVVMSKICKDLYINLKEYTKTISTERIYYTVIYDVI